MVHARSNKLGLLSLMTLFLVFCSNIIYAKNYTLNSPNNHLSMSIEVGEKLRWSVKYKNQETILPSEIALKIKGSKTIGYNSVVKNNTSQLVNNKISPIIRQKSAIIEDNYRELHLEFKSGFGVEFRAYNDGVAYRFFGTNKADIVIKDEILNLSFPVKSTSLYPEEESLISHFERLYVKANVKDITSDRFASLPTYIKTADNVHIVFTEADLFDYPGMLLYGTGKNSFNAGFPGYVTKATPNPDSQDRNQILEYADVIAKTTGARNFPWRVAVISDKDADLVESQLVYLLSRDNQIADTSWIKTGRVAWDWYNANNVYGVDFKAGTNTATYKYYIDFAAEHGLEYIILDEGWSKSTTNIIEMNPEMDVHELIRYGNKKGVKLILWSLWGPLDNDYKNILATYKKWGVAGIKIDFMQRADQYMVNYYEKIAREAAKNELLVDYHGGFKPSGLRRAFPNVLTYEGVKGNENNKWSSDVTPEYNVTLPFIRMVAGPMDYTPGAMVNTSKSNHRVSHYRPMAIGTRAHQVAMYVVFESPLQMLCDSPSTYSKELETTSFIVDIPSVWDETRVLAAAVGDYIVTARRNGENWYIGAMTDGTARDLEIDFSFLDKGIYQLDYIEDGANTENWAQDYNRKNEKISSTTRKSIRLAAGGGWSGIIKKE